MASLIKQSKRYTDYFHQVNEIFVFMSYTVESELFGVREIPVDLETLAYD